MPQPGTLPRWAETVSGTQASNVVGPAAGKQDTGYVTGGDIPTSGGLNWLFRWIYKWCQYVAGLTSEALTWTARQTFSGGATVVDPPVNATDAASKGYVDAEMSARTAADTDEASARAAAVTAEATARAAADTAEATARAAADALLMPKTGGTFSGTVTVGSGNDASALSNGGLELTSANALIDFKDLSSEDYDARIIKPAGSNLEVVGGPLIVPEPIGPRDAVTKGYVDARFVVAAVVESDGTIFSQVGSITLPSAIISPTGVYQFILAGATPAAIVVATIADYQTGKHIFCTYSVGCFFIRIAATDGTLVAGSFSVVVIKL
jgi:hypothetical protein